MVFSVALHRCEIQGVYKYDIFVLGARIDFGQDIPIARGST